MNILTDLEIERDKPEITEVTEEDIENILLKTREMVDLMVSKGGKGLSAPQVGINKKFFIMETFPEKVEIIINPIYFYKKKDLTKSGELSLSNPNAYIVERAKEIEVKYYSTDGKKLIKKNRHLKGEKAFIFQSLTNYCKGITLNSSALEEIPLDNKDEE